jgi:hypothetical protein
MLGKNFLIALDFGKTFVANAIGETIINIQRIMARIAKALHKEYILQKI